MGPINVLALGVRYDALIRYAEELELAAQDSTGDGGELLTEALAARAAALYISEGRCDR